MGLRDAGIPARDYGNDRPRIAVKLYEEDLVYNPNGFGEDGRTKGMWTVSAPMTKTMYVELHEDSTAENIIVQPADANSTDVVGKLIIEPKLKWTPQWTDNEMNRLPRANASWGDYSPRTGTVEFYGHAIDYIKIVDDNSAIEPLDPVKYVDDGEFDKSASDTNTIALAGVEANKGGMLPVLSNYYGI